MVRSVVTLNAGGTVYSALEETLTADRSSLLGHVFRGDSPEVLLDNKRRVFLDVDGEAFKYVLIWLRHSQLVPLSNEMACRVLLVAQQLQLHALAQHVSQQTARLTVNQEAFHKRYTNATDLGCALVLFGADVQNLSLSGYNLKVVDAARGCRGPKGPGGGGGLRSAVVRNPSQFRDFPSSPQFARPPRVRVGALCVPCAEVLLLEALGVLVTAPLFFRNFPQFSRNFSQFPRNFSQLHLTLPDHNPPALQRENVSRVLTPPPPPLGAPSPTDDPLPQRLWTSKCKPFRKLKPVVYALTYQPAHLLSPRGGRLLSSGTRPPPPLPALRAHLVILFSFPLPILSTLHPNTILEPNLDPNAHPNPQPTPNPTPKPPLPANRAVFNETRQADPSAERCAGRWANRVLWCVTRTCTRPPPVGRKKGKESFVVVRSRCQETDPADAHPSAHKSVLELANPRMDSECASGCTWSTARATALLRDGQSPE